MDTDSTPAEPVAETAAHTSEERFEELKHEIRLATGVSASKQPHSMLPHEVHSRPRKRPGIRLSEHRGQQAAVPRTFTGFGWETPAVLRALSTTDEPYVVRAYVLVHELRSAQGDFEVAFTRFHALMAPYVARCQQLALNTLEVDGAKSPWATWLRMLGLWSLRLPGVRQLVARQALKVGRSFALPAYD